MIERPEKEHLLERFSPHGEAVAEQAGRAAEPFAAQRAHQVHRAAARARAAGFAARRSRCATRLRTCTASASLCRCRRISQTKFRSTTESASTTASAPTGSVRSCCQAWRSAKPLPRSRSRSRTSTRAPCGLRDGGRRVASSCRDHDHETACPSADRRLQARAGTPRASPLRCVREPRLRSDQRPPAAAREAGAASATPAPRDSTAAARACRAG